MACAARVDVLARRVRDEPSVVGAEKVDGACAAPPARGRVDHRALDASADAIRGVIRRVADECLLEVVVLNRFEAEGREHEVFLP